MRIENYEVIQPFGVSAHGRSYLVKDSSGVEFVAKSLPDLDDDDFTWAQSRVEKVAEALGEASPVTALLRDEDNIPVVLSRLRRGMTLALAFQSGSLPEAATRWQILAEVARLLQPLHQADLAHGDICPANIVLGRGGKVHLIDLELERQATGTEGFSDGSGINLPADVFAWAKLASFLDLEADFLAGALGSANQRPQISVLESAANGQALGLGGSALPSVASLDVAAQLRAVSQTTLSPAKIRLEKRQSRAQQRKTSRSLNISEAFKSGWQKVSGLFGSFTASRASGEPKRNLLRFGLLFVVAVVAVSAGYYLAPSQTGTATPNPASSQTDWGARLQKLVTARDKALMSQDTKALAALYSGKPAALQADRATLSELSKSGKRIASAKTSIEISEVKETKSQVIIQAFIRQESYEVCDKQSRCKNYGPLPKRKSKVVLDKQSKLVVDIKTGV